MTDQAKKDTRGPTGVEDVDWVSMDKFQRVWDDRAKTYERVSELESKHDEARILLACAESDAYRQRVLVDELRGTIATKDAQLLEMNAKIGHLQCDLDLLHSWHYHRTTHEERGCRCDGECILSRRAEQASEMIVRAAKR